MQRPPQTQLEIVNTHAAALQESRLVHSDETLGWNLSHVDMTNREHSAMNTPINKERPSIMSRHFLLEHSVQTKQFAVATNANDNTAQLICNELHFDKDDSHYVVHED